MTALPGLTHGKLKNRTPLRQGPLARALGAQRLSATTAGIAFAFCPMAQSLGSRLQLLCIFPLAFALAAGLFGTFTPLASTWLIDNTGDKASPGLWLMFAAVLGIVATLIVYRNGEEAAKQQAFAT